MFYVKNDDMEDMFKKAAENFELNEDMAADWNGVRSALQNEGAITTPVKEKKRRKIYLLWWLLLISAILIGTYKAGFYISDKEQNAKALITKKQEGTFKNNLSKNKNAVGKNDVTKNLLHTNNYGINRSKKMFPGDNLTPAGKPLLSNNQSSEIEIAASSDTGKESLNSNVLSQTNITANQPANDQSVKSALHNNQLPHKNIGSLNNATTNNTETVQTNTLNPANQSKYKKKNDSYTRQAFAYAGFIGNADISFIKFQKPSLPGFGIGIIGGYHLKNGISIETGVVYDKKNYYTKGEYFDKGKLNYLQNVNLISADGNCHMWEIPLNIKYDFNTQKKHNWFVTAGVSSYIMNKEYYNFKYEKYGMINEHAYDYYHSTKNLFSVLNVGGGINIKTGNKYFLQAQPYYKIPLSGIGAGKLSLSSAGINISVTKRLH